MADIARERADLFASLRRTGMPLLAWHIAIPMPIVPEPTTAADRTSMIGTSTARPGGCAASRSAVTRCLSAGETGEAGTDIPMMIPAASSDIVAGHAVRRRTSDDLVCRNGSRSGGNVPAAARLGPAKAHCLGVDTE